MVVLNREGAVVRALHGAPGEAAAQERADVAEDRLATDDENPGVHYGVEGVETERRQVLTVIGKWLDRVDEARNLKREREEIK